MWEYARYLSSAGHEVTYVAAAYSGAAPEELVDGLRVIRLGRIHTLWLRSFAYYIRRARGQVDVVVAEGFGGSRIPRLVPLYVREPILTEWHQVYRPLFAAQYPRVMHAPLNLLEWLTARAHRGTLLRAGTEEVKQDFIGLGFRADRIFVLPVSVRDEWLNHSDLPTTGSQELIWLGKVRKYKRPDHAIRALTTVIRRFPGARLTIAGRHDDRAYEKVLVGLVRELDLEDHVEFRFDVSETEKRALLLRSRALVLPSAVEGFGIVVVEANSCGVPVIASSGVPASVVRDGHTGLRYPSGDIDALATQICRLFADDVLHGSLSVNARSFARQFGWRSIGGQYVSVIEDLIAGRQIVAAAPAQLESEIPV